MKRITLSALAALTLSGAAYAETLTFYTDKATGQVFTTPGEGRVEMGDFIDAKTVYLENQAQDSAAAKAKEKDEKKGYHPVKSKAKSIEFSGTHYFGFTSVNPKNDGVANSAGFELRRSYVQAKAYFTDKDYFRVTLDATKQLADKRSAAGEGKTYASVFFKYAYLWLNEVLPYTGVEVGIAHRPWIDYEEHNGWFWRSINKVSIEEGSSSAPSTESGPDLINSADLGVNFRTKTPYFTSEIGVFNGEGYHADKKANNQYNSTDLSVEWRFTGHLIGSGEKVGKQKVEKETYAHISTFGIWSKNHKDNDIAVSDASEYTRTFYGFHAVYNQPEFLIAAQYVSDEDKLDNVSGKTDRDVWSVNADIRPVEDWTVIARYDSWEKDDGTDKTEGTNTIFGVAYKYSKNVTFLANAKLIDQEKNGATQDVSADIYMLTTQVKW